jgi:hypothetical protein
MDQKGVKPEDIQSVDDIRKLPDIVDTLNIFRLYAFLVHQIAVVGDVVIDILDLLDDLLVLNLENFLP